MFCLSGFTLPARSTPDLVFEVVVWNFDDVSNFHAFRYGVSAANDIYGAVDVFCFQILRDRETDVPGGVIFF